MSTGHFVYCKHINLDSNVICLSKYIGVITTHNWKHVSESNIIVIIILWKNSVWDYYWCLSISVYQYNCLVWIYKYKAEFVESVVSLMSSSWGHIISILALTLKKYFNHEVQTNPSIRFHTTSLWHVNELINISDAPQ